MGRFNLMLVSWIMQVCLKKAVQVKTNSIN